MEKIKLSNIRGTSKLIFKGDILELEQYETEVGDLIFNPLNTRIHDIVYSAFGDIDNDDKKLFSPEVQEKILTSLKATHKDKTNKKLLASISKGIINPFVVNEYGVVLSGNNRLGLIRANIDKKDSPFKMETKIPVLLVKGNLTNKEILDWELSLQNETDIKKDYDEMNVVMQTQQLVNAGSSNAEILNITRYKDEKQIEIAVQIAELYDLLLIYAGVPKLKTLHRKVPVYSFLDGLASQLKKTTITKDEKNILKRVYFKTILGSTIPVQRLRTDLLGSFVGKTEIDTSDRLKLLTEIEEKFDKKLTKTIEKNKENKFEEEKIKMLDYKMDEDGVKEMFDNLSIETFNRVNFLKGIKESSYKAVALKIERNNKTINEIIAEEGNTIFHFEEDELTSFKEKIDQQINNLNKLKKIVEDYE